MHKAYFIKHITYYSEFSKRKVEDLEYIISRRVLDILIIVTYILGFPNVVITCSHSLFQISDMYVIENVTCWS